MGAIGGTILGKDGLGDLDGGDIFGGAGFEGAPDGADAVGPAPTGLLVYDFRAGIPAGMTERNSQTFTASGDFTDEDANVDLGNGDKVGIWEDVDSGLLPNDFDLQVFFAWFVAADTTTARAGPGVFDVAVSVDGLSPYNAGPVTDRNFDRILPARFTAEDVGNTATSFTSSTNTHVLTGDELIADDATIHTMGWSKLGTEWRTFFDGILSSTFTLTAGEQADIEACTRIGIWYGQSGINFPVQRWQFLVLDTQGNIFP
jgi:hypothetical protein